MSYASLKTLRPFFTNKCGRLLAGGKVYTYEVGTLIPKATYKDAAGLTENTNPIVLDVSGEADIYINSDYRFQIFDRDGVLIDDVDSVAPTQRISSAFLIDESGFTQAQINATTAEQANILNNQAFGVGQSWQKVLASRAKDTTYTNSTGKAIVVKIQLSDVSGDLTLSVNNFDITDIPATNRYGWAEVIVPNSSTYKVTGTGLISNWQEFR